MIPETKDLVFQFLIKHLQICSYKFFYRILGQKLCLAMLYKFSNSSPIISFFNLYLINQLSPFGPISEIDCCQVILFFLFRFLLSSIFAIQLSTNTASSLEKIVKIATGLGDIHDILKRLLSAIICRPFSININV